MTKYRKFKVPRGEQYGYERLSYYHGGIGVKDYTTISTEEQDEE